MAFTNLLHLVSLITLLTGISCTPPWDTNVGRYDSYNLEKGPVFYEAYYPESNESPSSRNGYQEKRYFDRGAIRERSFQIPSASYEYSEDSAQIDAYPDRGRQIQYTDLPDPPFMLPNGNDYFHERARGEFQGENFVGLQTSDAKDYSLEEPRLFSRSEAEQSNDYSKLARRGVPREFENWNSLNYVERVKQHPRPLYLRPDLQAGGYDTIDRPVRRVDARSQFPFRREVAGGQNRIEAEPEGAGVLERRARGFDPRNFRLPNSLDYRRQMVRYRDEIDPGSHRREDAVAMNDAVPEESVRPADNMPVENIFEPRPQIINYVFSNSRPRKFEEEARKKIAKDVVAEEPTPRNYGDNIVQEEIKKAIGDREEAKVTSIEVSEVPRHKTRHHHGEWPKRDYSHRHRV